MSKLVDVSSVEVIGDHRLRLTFDDGVVGDIDFAGRKWRRVFEPLADQAFFAQVRVDPEIGTVVWPNGVDMAPETLYKLACKQLCVTHLGRCVARAAARAKPTRASCSAPAIRDSRSW